MTLDERAKSYIADLEGRISVLEALVTKRRTQRDRLRLRRLLGTRLPHPRPRPRAPRDESSAAGWITGRAWAT